MELPFESLKKSLDNIIKESGFVNYKIEVSSGSNKGDNYLGVVCKVEVTGTKENNKEDKLHLFCKVPVSSENLRKDFGLREYFLREIKVYDEVLNFMKNFEVEKGIKNGFTSYAKCLSTNSINLEEFLILEDLSKKNYRMFNRLEKLDLAHTELVMKALGKFHALSFAIKDQKPEMFNKYSRELPELLFKEEFSPAFKSYTDGMLEGCYKVMEFDGIYKEKWEGLYSNYYQYLTDCVNVNLAEPYAVITHGDCWNNNMMFQYENEKPTEMCLLDFQVTRYASPVLDLVYYIFCCTENPMRKLHYETLLKTYYNSLSQFITELGSSPEKLFPYSEFQNQLRKFGKLGVAVSVFAVPGIVRQGEDTKPLEEMLSNSQDITDDGKTSAIWQPRFSDVLKDSVDLGYL